MSATTPLAERHPGNPNAVLVRSWHCIDRAEEAAVSAQCLRHDGLLARAHEMRFDGIEFDGRSIWTWVQS